MSFLATQACTIPSACRQFLVALFTFGGMRTVWDDDVVCCGVWVGPVGMEKMMDSINN